MRIWKRAHCFSFIRLQPILFFNQPTSANSVVKKKSCEPDFYLTMLSVSLHEFQARIGCDHGRRN